MQQQTPGKTVGDLALDYAVHGLPVFPCVPFTKRPYIKNGHKMATRDLDQIRAWWEAYPDAMIGCPMGEPSGLYCVDLDVDKETGETVGENSATALGIMDDLRTGIAARTPSGGAHYYFTWPGDDFGNTASKIGPQIDTRGMRDGKGGYTILPGSVTTDGGAYTWDFLGVIEHGLDAMPELPDSVIALLQAGKEDPAQNEISSANVFDINLGTPRHPGLAPVEAWAQAALDDECRKLATAASGQRNHQLNASTFSLAQIVAGGHLDEQTVRQRLLQAATECGLVADDGMDQCRATFNSGWQAGFAEPRGPKEEDAILPQVAAAGSKTAPSFDHAPTIVWNKETEQATQVEPTWKVQTAHDFTADFVSPEYLVEGIMQRGRLYTLTAPTGHGKTAAMLYLAACVASGREFCGQEVEQGAVLFLAGENPDDVRARVIGTMEALDFDVKDLPLYFVPGTFSIRADMERLKAEADGIPNLALTIVDTFAAYFDGDDENHNKQALDFARVVRQISEFGGKPAVVMPAHPIKNAQKTSLTPKGGSSLLNEVDGNLTLWNEDTLLSLHWQGKHRGPDFDPVQMELKPHESERIKDHRGRIMPTVVAHPVLTLRAMELAGKTVEAETEILRSIEDNPVLPERERASRLGMDRSTMRRAIRRMTERKWLRRHGRKFTLTADGQEALADGQNGVEQGDF